MLHDAFNVLLNGSPPITIEVCVGIRHLATRGGFIYWIQYSRGIFDTCKFSFNFNPSWASLQLNGLYRDKEIALLVLRSMFFSMDLRQSLSRSVWASDTWLLGEVSFIGFNIRGAFLTHANSLSISTLVGLLSSSMACIEIKRLPC